jgi:hypothetical protein
MITVNLTSSASTYEICGVDWRYRFRQRRRIIRPNALFPQPYILLSSTPRVPVSSIITGGATNTNTNTAAVAVAALTPKGNHAPAFTCQLRSIIQPLGLELIRREYLALHLEAAHRRRRPKVRAVRGGSLCCEARRDVLHCAERAELGDGRRVGVA